MARAGKIHEGDKGTDFIARFLETKVDPDNPESEISSVLEVDGMVQAKIWLTKPDGTVILRDETEGVELYTDGLDGKIHFKNDEAINPGQSFVINQGNKMWAIEAWIKLTDGAELNTDKEYFLVRGKRQ